ncbi:MAG: T9SS type A sorting domain-containing protein [Bacteroidales bacterium]|nr:T9SS type A sorting domain-containing protein [Bacteroidales bacterium]
MKKFYALFVLSVLISWSVKSQHFIFEPTDNYEDEINLNSYTEHRVYMKNLTGGILTLSWERIYLDFPIEWNVTTCDNGGCYTAIPESGTMQPIQDTTRAFLELTINAADRTGTGIVKFNVYDYKHPDQADTLTFTIHAGTTTGIEIEQQQNTLSVYPNPADDFINIHTGIYKDVQVTISNIQGQVVLTDEMSGNKITTYSISEFEQGLYFVTIKDKSGILDRKKLLVK